MTLFVPYGSSQKVSTIRDIDDYYAVYCCFIFSTVFVTDIELAVGFVLRNRLPPASIIFLDRHLGQLSV